MERAGAAEMAAPLAKPAPPPPGKIYHGVYPGGITGDEDDLTIKDLHEYESAVGQPAAWVYFSHNWFTGQSRAFPRAAADWIRAAGSTPYIRLMLREKPEQDRRDKTFTLQRIIDGYFDRDLRAWARGAREYGDPLLAEWGTEFNGIWFPWNGGWHGRDKKKGFGDPTKYDGPERFAAAFRHIVTVMRAEGATNIAWVWHADVHDDPREDWNRMENYYPGDDVVDFVALSTYGPITPDEPASEKLGDMLDYSVPRMAELAPGKPVIVAEFGCTAGNATASPATWAADALDTLLARKYPQIVGFSWWNERWPNDDNPKHDTTMRVQDLPDLAHVFRDKLAARVDELQPKMVTQPAKP
jgi:hypothetical protein